MDPNLVVDPGGADPFEINLHIYILKCSTAGGHSSACLHDYCFAQPGVSLEITLIKIFAPQICRKTCTSDSVYRTQPQFELSKAMS